MNDVKKYSKLVSIRNLLKEVQQISWDITQLDKKFPIEDAEEIGYQDLLYAYLAFNERIQKIASSFEGELDNDPVVEKIIKMKKNNNHEDKNNLY